MNIWPAWEGRVKSVILNRKWRIPPPHTPPRDLLKAAMHQGYTESLVSPWNKRHAAWAASCHPGHIIPSRGHFWIGSLSCPPLTSSWWCWDQNLRSLPRFHWAWGGRVLIFGSPESISSSPGYAVPSFPVHKALARRNAGPVLTNQHNLIPPATASDSRMGI